MAQFAKKAHIADEAIADLYRQGFGLRTAAKQLGVSTGLIVGRLRAMGMPTRNPLAVRSFPTRHDAFLLAEADPEAAYWVGFMMADGCVHRRKDSWAISASSSLADFDHIKKLRSFLGAEHVKLHHVDHVRPGIVLGRPCTLHGLVSVTVGSKHLAQSLIAYGVTPRKSLTARVVRLQRNRHFWRGVIDGDGTLGWKTGQPQPLIRLIGAVPLMNQFAKFIESVVGRRPTVALPACNKGRIGNVGISGRRAANFVAYLYQPGDQALARKNDRAEAIKAWLVNYVPKQNDWAGLSASRLRSELAKYGSWGGVAAGLRIDKSVLLDIRTRLGLHTAQPRKVGRARCKAPVCDKLSSRAGYCDLHGKRLARHGHFGRLRRDHSHLTRADMEAMFKRHGTWRAAGRASGLSPGTISKLKARLLPST